METLNVLHTLLSPPNVSKDSDPEAEIIHPELNGILFAASPRGREYSKTNGAARYLRDAIQEAQQTILKTSAVVPISGLDSSPLSSIDAPLLCSNIGIICQVFVRMTLAKEQVATNYTSEDRTLFMDTIDAMIDILRYDITSALNPVPAPSESPRTAGGAAAAAAAAANAASANAAALAALLPFSIDRCISIISSLGRMVENSEQCKAHAKSKGVLPVLLDCFKVKEVDTLYQVADKLLHLSVHIGDTPEFLQRGIFQVRDNDVVKFETIGQHEDGENNQIKRVDPNILCSVATGYAVPDGSVNNDSPDMLASNSAGEKPPLVRVEAVLALLEASHATANKTLVFRHLRWIAALVDLPGNAQALGERAITLFLQILGETPRSDELRFAFLAKCIRAIVLENSAALELCGSSHLDPSAYLFKFLHHEVEPAQADHTTTGDSSSTFLSQSADDDTTNLDVPHSDKIGVSTVCKLEWIDEYNNQEAFMPKPLTEACHNIDAFLLVANALTGLTGAFQKWNSAGNGSVATDFSELIACKVESDAQSTGKAGIAAAAAGSKKKLPADAGRQLMVGEAVLLAILEKGMQIPQLVSKYAAVNPAVCVTLLELLNNLMTIPSGLKVLLHLAKLDLLTHTSADRAVTSTELEAVGEWPLSTQLCSLTEHAHLLNPLLGVLQSPQTSFIEIEAAVQTLALMTSDLECVDKDVTTLAPEHVAETSKGPTKGGAAAVPPPPAAPTVPDLVVKECDRIINAAVGCGALVLLVAFMDQARIPVGQSGLSDRVKIMEKKIEEMVTKFIGLAQIKQANIIAKYREKFEHDQPPTIESTPTQAPADLDLPYQARWAQLLLDQKFSIPRFGYESYSALLLASELVLPELVSALLNAGACSETSSPEGVTPLMIAFLVGSEEMVIDLLDARANVNAITSDGQDLTVWNCALVSPLKARVSSMITMTYTNPDTSNTGPTMNSRIQLDSIEGSLQFLDMCLDAGVDPNVSNANGDFLLHALLSKSIVRRRLRGLDLCFRYNSCYEDRRRLQRAVTDLIEAHAANVNSCNRLGQTPLHLALLCGFTGIVKILLKRGANPNVQGIYGHLPLHYACLGFCGSLDGSDGEAVEIIRLLLELASKFACTVGVHSDRRKHKSAAEKQALAIENILESGLQSVIEPQAIVQKLASAQQMLTTSSFVGKFLPWHFTCGAYVQLSSVLCLDDAMQKWFEANGHARADILRYLLHKWKTDISACAGDGITALHLATKSDVDGNNLPVIDLLLETNTRGDVPSALDINAVHEHILIDSLPVIPSGAYVALVGDDQDVKQAFVSSRSSDSKYHIILADGRHLDGVLRDKLQVITDPHRKTSHRLHRLHHYKYLLPMESRFAALHYCLQSNHDTLALRLLALPNISLDPEGSDLPLLALACAARQTPEVVKRLINQQANMRVNLPLRSAECGLTTVDVNTSISIAHRKHAAALHYAVMYDDAAMVEALLSSPGEVVHPNVRRSGDGFTPLHLACEMENMKIIKLLLDHGASLTQLSSMSANGVSSLQLLTRFDTLENERLRELIAERYLRPEMLLEGSIGGLTARPNPALDDSCTVLQEASLKPENLTCQGQPNDAEDSDAPLCALLREEVHNHDLFERLQSLNGDKCSSHDALNRRLAAELEKSDAVLSLFFDLMKQPFEATDTTLTPNAADSNPQAEQLTPLVKAILKLNHPHECYRQFVPRSQWTPKGTKTIQAVSKLTIHREAAAQTYFQTMKTLTENERKEDGGCCGVDEPVQVPQLDLSSLRDCKLRQAELAQRTLTEENNSSWLPPVHANTTRVVRSESNNAQPNRNQTARICFAPPSKVKSKSSSYSVRHNSSHPAVPSATVIEAPTDLREKQLNTARCFAELNNWQKSMAAGVLKNLLGDIQEVLCAAVYHQPETTSNLETTPSSSDSVTERMPDCVSEIGDKLEYFSLVEDMQEKVRLQEQERKRLTTKLAMEQSLEQDLAKHLQQLERELAQLHMRHAHNRAEIEGERRAVQILERDYASLIEQEQELERDCEVFELQLNTQRAQLKEIRSQQLYLDFVSSAPLKRHMEEKKWQEQHAAVVLQVQNAEAENHALENEVKKLEEEAANLEAQYGRDVQTKQQSETSLAEIRVNYERFQEAFERTRVCYTPRPDWDRIVDETPELSVQKYHWEMVDSDSSQDLMVNRDIDDEGRVLEHITTALANGDDDQLSNSKDRTKTLVREMLHWIERLQKHCGVNLHLSRIWHDVEEARVELNILHHQLDRAVRKSSMMSITLPNMSGVITIAAATSPTSPTKRRQDYIMALGMHEGIPLFLRHRGKLKRRILKKLDVEKVVRKVWVEKRKREQRNPLGRFPLEQVLYEKLHRKYGFQPLIAEWGYNLLLALQMFCWDSEIEMFLLCLTGAVSDLVYVDQVQMIQGCQQLLLRMCELYNIESFETERRILLKDALVALRTFFPLKTSAQLQALEQAIIRDMHKMKRGGNDSILYIEDILPLNVKYPSGFFVKTIRTQHFKEIQDYYALLLR
ncbi:unnamed protein product [Phytophthora fragariaefolia]|uniref:Unnamed protein product n=1 Tax=Phytophthora fragariaefolia TaxID=1490495 RepID=A0A9W6YFQ5_9STRA|nr:unnamed protein product [Phytophthora fragariaefolia]